MTKTCKVTRIVAILLLATMFILTIVACNPASSDGNGNGGNGGGGGDTTQPQEYTITYHLNGGTLGDNSPMQHTFGIDTQLVDASRVGYTFDGWYDDVMLSGNKLTILRGDSYSSNIILYANWKGNEYTILYNTNGGDLSENSPIKHIYGTDTVLISPTRVGYSFIGWFDNMQMSGKSIRILGAVDYLENIELHAKWQPIEYNISYEMNGGTLGENSPSKHIYGSTTQLVDASRAGFIFDGWYERSDFNGIPIVEIGATQYVQNITLYAKWTGETYTVSFADMDGSPLDLTEVPFTNGASTELPTISHSGYLRFDSWKSQIHGGGNVVNSDSVLTENTVVYANWVNSNLTYYWSIDGTVASGINTPVRNIEIPAWRNGDEVTVVGDNFADSIKDSSIIENIILPKTIQKIGKYAFRNTSITIFNLPARVTHIGNYAFSNSKLTVLNIPENSLLSSIGKYAFNRVEMSSLIIPKTVTTVGSDIFGTDFLDKKDRTIYVEEFASRPSGWNSGWFSGFTILDDRYVIVWGVVLSSDGNNLFVDQFTKTQDNIYRTSPTNYGGGDSPIRVGFTFLYWATDTSTYLDLNGVVLLTDGTNIRAMWSEDV